MKIQLIGQALDEIKEEDQNNLSILERKLDEMETEFASKYENISRLSREHGCLEHLDKLSNNIFNHIHMLLPIVEIPLGILLLSFAFTMMSSGAMIVILFILTIIMEADAINTLVDEYPKILDSNNGIKAYATAFKKLLLNKHDVRLAMINCYNNLLNASSDAESYEKELAKVKGETDKIRRELLHLEGYISSIEYIIEKQYFEELSEKTDIVQFIRLKKELKKGR